jgi:hypothetical protein
MDNFDHSHGTYTTVEQIQAASAHELVAAKAQRRIDYRAVGEDRQRIASEKKAAAKAAYAEKESK